MFGQQRIKVSFGQQAKFFFTLLLFLFVGYSATLAPPVVAVKGIFGTTNPVVICENISDLDIFGLKCLEGIFSNVLSKVIVLLGIGLFLLLLYGGLRYITAGGDEKSIDSSRKILSYAVSGFGISVALYFITKVFLENLDLGAFLQFQIPCNATAQAWAIAKNVPQICP